MCQFEWGIVAVSHWQWSGDFNSIQHLWLVIECFQQQFVLTNNMNNSFLHCFLLRHWWFCFAIETVVWQGELCPFGQATLLTLKMHNVALVGPWTRDKQCFLSWRFLKIKAHVGERSHLLSNMWQHVLLCPDNTNCTKLVSVVDTLKVLDLQNDLNWQRATIDQ